MIEKVHSAALRVVERLEVLSPLDDGLFGCKFEEFKCAFNIQKFYLNKNIYFVKKIKSAFESPNSQNVLLI